MRLSTIAACLLLLASASPALACIEHSPERTDWFHERATSSWGVAWARAEEMWWEGMAGPWLFGAGSASVALVGVSFRAYSRAGGREPMLDQ